MPILPELFNLLSQEEQRYYTAVQHRTFQTVSQNNTETLPAAELNVITLFIVLICLMRKYQLDIDGGIILTAQLELMFETYCQLCSTYLRLAERSELPPPNAYLQSLTHLLNWHDAIIGRHMDVHQAVFRQKNITIDLTELLFPLHHIARQAKLFRELAAAPCCFLFCAKFAKKNQALGKINVDISNNILSFLRGPGHLISEKQMIRDNMHSKITKEL